MKKYTTMALYNEPDEKEEEKKQVADDNAATETNQEAEASAAVSDGPTSGE